MLRNVWIKGPQKKHILRTNKLSSFIEYVIFFYLPTQYYGIFIQWWITQISKSKCFASYLCTSKKIEFKPFLAVFGVLYWQVCLMKLLLVELLCLTQSLNYLMFEDHLYVSQHLNLYHINLPHLQPWLRPGWVNPLFTVLPLLDSEAFSGKI